MTKRQGVSSEAASSHNWHVGKLGRSRREEGGQQGATPLLGGSLGLCDVRIVTARLARLFLSPSSHLQDIVPPTFSGWGGSQAQQGERNMIASEQHGLGT